MESLMQKNKDDIHTHLKTVLAEPDGRKYVNMVMIQVQHVDLSREHQRKLHKAFFLSLMILSNGSNVKTVIWIKEIIHPDTCKNIIMDAKYTGKFVEKLQDIINDSTELLLHYTNKKLCSCSCFSKLNMYKWKRYITIFVLVPLSYLDFIKDFTFIVILFYLLQETVFTYPTALSSQLTWLLLMSVAVPPFISALETAHKHPLLTLGCSLWHHYTHNHLPRWKLRCIKILTVIFYPLVPAILIISKVKTTEKMRELLEKWKMCEQLEEGDHSLEKVGINLDYLEEVRKALLIYKRNEFRFEMVLQLTVQNVMLSLNHTVSPTHSGLEAVFRKDFDWFGMNFSHVFLIISVLWSFKSAAWTYVKIKAEENINLLVPLCQVSSLTAGLACFVHQDWLHYGLLLPSSRLERPDGSLECRANITGSQVPG